MPALPYAIGAFMMTPLVLWALMWLFAFPGEKAGFEAYLTVGMLAVSMPMALSFLIVNLSFISNSMLRRDEFGLPAWAPARWLLLATPALTVILTTAVTAMLGWVDGSVWAWTVPPLVGIAFAWACQRTVKRAREGHPADRQRQPASTLRHAVRAAGRLSRRALFMVPVVGWLLRDAAEGRPSAAGFLVLNIGLGLVIATVFIGIEAVFFAALALVPLAFIAMIGLTRGQDA